MRARSAGAYPQHEEAEGRRHTFDLFRHIDEELFIRLIVISVVIGTLAIIYVAGALITFLALKAMEHFDQFWAAVATMVIAPFAAIFFVGVGIFVIKVYLDHKNHGSKR